MIRSVEFDLVTKSEANQRFASRAGMFAKSNRVQKQRAAVRDVLAAHHTAPRLFVNATADPIADDARAVAMAQVQASLGATKPNRIIVKLTRIAPGELDDDNLRGALKAVRDAIAAWIGTNDRDPLISWEYGQERGGQHVYRCRVEITDLAPGEPRRVVLAETGSEGRAAKSRIKRLTTRAAKGATKVTPEQRFRADSRQQLVSGARSDAEFARRLKDGDDGVTRRNGVLERAGGGARAAAEAAFAKVTGRDPRRIRSPAEQDADTLAAERAKVTAPKPARPDPDAEAMTAMRDLARSQRCLFTVEGVVCGALPGQPCRVIHDPAGGPRSFEYGVHGERARAAGLPPYPSAAELNAGLRPVRVTQTCPTCEGDEDAPRCNTCNRSGKVAAWRWEVPMSKADVDAVEGEMKACGMKRGRDYTRSGNVLAPVAKGATTDSGDAIRALTNGPTVDLAERAMMWQAKSGKVSTTSRDRQPLPESVRRPDGDPGEERPARDLAPCSVCGAVIGEACSGGTGLLFGVHTARAKAAGLNGVPTPTKAPTTGVRKLAPVAGPPVLQAWARLPWASPCADCDGDGWHPMQIRCDACEGEGRKLTREPRRDGADPPMAIRYRVPAEHVARFGPEVVLTRRPHVDASGEACWLYA